MLNGVSSAQSLQSNFDGSCTMKVAFSVRNVRNNFLEGTVTIMRLNFMTNCIFPKQNVNLYFNRLSGKIYKVEKLHILET
jgi:hypothetical protein